MLQNAPNCTIKKNFWGEACSRTPIANAWLRHASQAPTPPKKLLLKNLFENPPWQTVDCV